MKKESSLNTIKSRTQAQKTSSKQGRNSAGTPSKSEKGPSQETILVALADDAELLHNDDEEFARILINDHRVTWRIGAKEFRHWLQAKFWARNQTTARSQAIAAAIETLRGIARHRGRKVNTAVRIAHGDNCIYLDLANEAWQAVRIDASGWRVEHFPDVVFVRASGMLPLPTPERNGAIDELRALVNVKSDEDWILIIAWLMAALYPTGPYPVLSVNGEQGSAKSTLCRMLRALVDPNKAPLRSAPRDERDLVIAGTNGHVIALENLSKIQDWLSDALCRLSTGGAFGTRLLYSDDSEKLFSEQCPVILNGITELITRSDLLDRAICISLPAIPDSERTTESDLLAKFERIRGRVLGALLDALSQALSKKSDVRLPSPPRMADFATLIVAAEPKLPGKPGDFLRAYQRNRASADESAIEGSVLSAPVRALMDTHKKWQGTATELNTELARLAGKRVSNGPNWPKTLHLLTGQLKRIVPNLRRIGIEVEFGKDRGKRFVRLTRKDT